MRKITLELPYPPSVNHYYFTTKFGRRLIGKKGKQYIADVCDIVSKLDWETTSKPVKIEVLLYVPDRRRRDWDNPMKVVGDSLEKAKIYEDDSQIFDAHVKRMTREDSLREGYDKGAVVVTVFCT